jgi:phage terminase large subunit
MKLTPELILKLERFQPRPYQTRVIKAIEGQQPFKKVLAILPRRAGKDIVAFNLAVRQCMRRTCTVYYVFPTYAMGRKIIWDAIDNDGHRILDWYCPDELVEQKNSSDMKIRFKNNSIMKFVGSDNYDSLVGSNFQAVIFSEYALQDPNAYAYLRPIMVANGAWALFITTPRGKNHLYDLYNIALNNSEWFCLKMSVLETGHIPIAAIQKEKEEGLISEDLIQQEYFCSFELGVEGAYYTKYIDRMRLKGQIGDVAWDSAWKVHCSFDLGVRDTTAIIFFQVCNNIIRVIDFYENSDQGLEHYAKVLEEKGYNYGSFIMPHDIMVREFAHGGVTRYEKACQLGIPPTPCPNIPIIDGIECVRSTFSRMWIDETHCRELIKALENYRKDIKKGDSKKPVYADHPLHNWASNAADAMRYLCVGLSKISDDTSPEELDRLYNETRLGPNANMPPIFRDDLPEY